MCCVVWWLVAWCVRRKDEGKGGEREREVRRCEVTGVEMRWREGNGREGQGR